jgi:hypothetical protein
MSSCQINVLCEEERKRFQKRSPGRTTISFDTVFNRLKKVLNTVFIVTGTATITKIIFIYYNVCHKPPVSVVFMALVTSPPLSLYT